VQPEYRYVYYAQQFLLVAQAWFFGGGMIADHQGFDKHGPLPEVESPTNEPNMRDIRAATILIGALNGSSGLIALLARGAGWQPVAFSLISLLTAGYAFLAINYFYPRKKINAGLVGTSLLFALGTITSASLFVGVGLPAAIIYMVFSLSLSSLVHSRWQSKLFLFPSIAICGTAALMGSFSPFEQISIPLFNTLMPAIFGILFMVFIVMLAMEFITTTLRIRLVMVFLAIVIIPLSVLSLIQSRFTFSVLMNQVHQNLELAANQTALNIDSFLDNAQLSVIETTQLPILQRYLELPEEERKGSREEVELRITLRTLEASQLNSTNYLSSYAILDMDGMNIYDTIMERVPNQLAPEALRKIGINVFGFLNGRGVHEGNRDYFKIPARSGVAYISPVLVHESNKGYFFISAPIRGRNGQTLGVLRARFDGLMLQDLLHQHSGLVSSKSYAILLDENNIRLADAFTPFYIYKAVAPLSSTQVRTLQANGRLPVLETNRLWTNEEIFDKMLRNYEQNPYFTTQQSLAYGDGQYSEIGAIVRIKAMPWKVVYLQTDFSTEALHRDQNRLTIFVTTLIASLIGFVAVGAAQLLSNPINRLTETAHSISQGNLEARAPMTSSDEFGMLGAAFNMMTSQLKALIIQLEDRVKARTIEIEKQNDTLAARARQLQTISEVARQIVSAQELENLLQTVTHLISDRFSFYHVGIFLIDERKEYAFLRAANSEGGLRMLDRKHRLSVGKVGIVGYATGTGQPRIATDVGEDAVYFNNPDLPETRSEMALPLTVGGQIIGAIDIQSKEPNAFITEDIELFSTLADQVAIAIYNNQLYMETRRALEEAHNVHRQYLQGEWAKDTAQRKVLGYLYNNNETLPLQAELPLWGEVFNSGTTIRDTIDSEDMEKSAMAVPISVRGETIGVIHVQDQGDDREWTDDEVSVVNSIANQVAVALENARLFENTVRRAEREKKVLQITAKIRSTNEPDEMMQIAIGELQQALQVSRTQIYIRQSGEMDADEPAEMNGNGAQRGRKTA
jgi:GAF domain-containing protein/HAMP domain-containing protein